MNTDFRDPSDEPEEIPALPAGEMPDVDQLPPTEPSGPPAGSAPPFDGIAFARSPASTHPAATASRG